MGGVNVRSTDPILALDSELGVMAGVVEEAIAQAQNRTEAMKARLERVRTRCQGQVLYWRRCIDNADEEDDTSRYHEELEIWEEKLESTGSSINSIDKSSESLQGSIHLLQSLALETTPRARSFLRQRVLDIQEYAELTGFDGSASSMANTGGQVAAFSKAASNFYSGYRRSKRDPNDWLWTNLYGPVPCDLPERVGLESFLGLAENQKETPQCVCFSLAGLKHHDELKSSGQWLQFNPDPIYRQCKKHDGESTDGTTIRDAMKVASKVGLCADDSKRYFVKGYARLENANEICHALSLRKVVMLGVRISGNELSALSKNAVVSAPTTTNGGHCMLVTGYDVTTKMFRVRNSWGVDWADAGHCWLPFEYLLSDPEFDAWTTVCEKVDLQDTRLDDTAAFPPREFSSSSNYAWFDPRDVSLNIDDGAKLDWTRITAEVAQATMETVVRMRPFIDIATLKSSNFDAYREKLGSAVDVSGDKIFTDEDLKAFDLYFGGEAIRIDGDGKGGFLIVNGRHRLYMAQQNGVRSVPVSISNIARNQLATIIATNNE